MTDPTASVFADSFSATRSYARALADDWRGLTPATLKTEVLSGLTVSLALVPEAVAFALVAGLAPLVGLYAAFIVGLVTALFGGRPGMISGATGALAVVMVEMTHEVVDVRGLSPELAAEYIFATVILMGAFQVGAGLLRWGKFIRMVPYPVMLGFVNGLAIVIGLAQLEQFRVERADGTEGWMRGAELWLSLGLVGLTMLVIWLLPKVSRVVPAPLAAIGIVAALVIGLDLDVPTVGDLASIGGGLPTASMPEVPFTWETLRFILPYAVILAAIGLIESLLTLNLVGEIVDKKGGASQECTALGGANLLSGFFGSMGGCAMIGQSMINIKSGGRTRVAATVAALLLLCYILFASPVIELIPLAALVGVMFMVVIGTFAWKSIQIMRRIPRADAAVIVLVTVVTVMEDLAVAVVFGVIVSALVFAWRQATRMEAEIETDGSGAKIYRLSGPLFFGSVQSFTGLFSPKDDPDRVVIDFRDSRVADHSGLSAIDALAERYARRGKDLRLRHLSPDCRDLLGRAGQLIEPSPDDPEYGVAADYRDWGIHVGRTNTGH